MATSLTSPTPPARTGRQRLAAGLRLAFLVSFTLVTAYPLFWMFTVALKTQREFNASPVALPRNPTLAVFWGVLTQPLTFTFARNSLVVSTVSSVLILVLGSLAGYALARMEFRGKNVILLIFLTTQWIPLIILVIPLLVTVQLLHLYGSLVGLTLAYLSSNLGLATFILRGFFRRLPQEYIDAAQLDGATDLQTFYHIVLPQVTAGLGVVAILSFISVWNEYFMALILLNDQSKFTLPLGVSMYQGQYGVDWPSLTAVLLIATLPTLLLYFVFTERFIAAASQAVGLGRSA